MESIVRLLLHGCIVVQLTWLTGGSTLDDKKITDYHQSKISWLYPTTEPDSRNISSSNLDLQNHPIFKIHTYNKLEISPVEIQPTMEGDGGEKLTDRQVSSGVPAEEIGTGDGDHRERNYVRVAQGEISRTTDERNSPAEEETKVDLSFLDNLGGLASYLPDIVNRKARDMLPNKEASFDWYSIFNWFLSKLRDTDTKTTNVAWGNHETINSGPKYGKFYINKILRKPNETNLLPNVRGRYIELTSTSIDPRVRLRLLAELNRGNITFISETPILHPTTNNRPKEVLISPLTATSTQGNYQQPIENYLAQKMREIINSAIPPIRDAVNFNRDRDATATIESRKSKENTYNETVRIIHSENSKVMHRSNDSTDAPAAG